MTTPSTTPYTRGSAQPPIPEVLPGLLGLHPDYGFGIIPSPNRSKIRPRGPSEVQAGGRELGALVAGFPYTWAWLAVARVLEIPKNASVLRGSPLTVTGEEKGDARCRGDRGSSPVKRSRTAPQVQAAREDQREQRERDPEGSRASTDPSVNL